MKLVAGFLCFAIVTCEAKAVVLNHPNGTADDPALLLETGRSMTLSHRSLDFPSTYWVLPDGENVACNKATRSGRFKVICENGNSKLTASNLATCDTGIYNFRFSRESFDFKVEIIKVSVSASMDDGCNFVNIVAHIESKNYEIIEMTSPYFDKAIHQFHHRFLFSIMKKDPCDFGGYKRNITIGLTIQKRSTTEDHPLNRTVDLKAADKCCPTGTSYKRETAHMHQTVTPAPSSSVKNRASAILLMGFLVLQILLFV